MHHGSHTEEGVGSAIGASLALLNAVLASADLSWENILATAALSALGATVGFVITTSLKWLKKKFL